MIPPYLLIHYTWIGRGTTLQFMCRVAFVLSFATSIAAMLLLWAVYPKDYDFGASTKVRTMCRSMYGVYYMELPVHGCMFDLGLLLK